MSPLKPIAAQVPHGQPMPHTLASSLHPAYLFSFTLCYEEMNPKDAGIHFYNEKLVCAM